MTQNVRFHFRSPKNDTAWCWISKKCILLFERTSSRFWHLTGENLNFWIDKSVQYWSQYYFYIVVIILSGHLRGLTPLTQKLKGLDTWHFWHFDWWDAIFGSKSLKPTTFTYNTLWPMGEPFGVHTSWTETKNRGFDKKMAQKGSFSPVTRKVFFFLVWNFFGP